MYIYVFGNEDVKEDNKAIIAARKIKKNFKDINFIIIKPNQDLPFEGDVVIMDTVENDLKKYFNENIAKEQDELKLDAEKIIRAYDPCMSCATNFLKIDWIVK